MSGFLPSPDGPVPSPMSPPPPDPDPLAAAVVLARLSPAERAALIEQALYVRFRLREPAC